MQAAGPFNEWICDRQSHPSHNHVDLAYEVPSNEWICDRQSHPSHNHVDLAYEVPLPLNCANCRPGNLLVRHGTLEHLWLAANCRCVHSCCRTVCTELCPYLRVVSVQ